MVTLQTQYETHYTQAIKTAMNDIWHKLHDNLTTLVRQLDVNEEGKGNRLYDSVFDRAIELTEMLGTCNVTGDSQMEAMKRQLEQAFHVSGERSLNLDQIKRSPRLREETRNKVTAAIAALPSLDM
jgi:predicted GNAT superfamily acetyltransferase